MSCTAKGLACRGSPVSSPASRGEATSIRWWMARSERRLPRASMVAHTAIPACKARPSRSRGRLCPPSALSLPAAGFLATQTALPLLAATCTAPALMGLIKNEYTVSFGYAAAMAVSTSVALVAGGLPGPAVYHAGLIALYGFRLGGFLLWRQLTIDKFKDFVERIEARAPPQRWKRMPFILGCAALYVGLLAPLVLTARYAAICSAESLLACQAFLLLGLIGWLVEAVGDYQKSAFKAKNPDRWVDQGLYAFIRHPNYTGEQLLWASSFMAGVSCAHPWAAEACPWILGGALGLLGIQFVLMQATTGLERRQQEQYGSQPEFQGYKAGTWAGFTLKRKP